MEDGQFSRLERLLNPFISNGLWPVFWIARLLHANCTAAVIAVEMGVRSPSRLAAARAFDLARAIALSSNCASARARSAVGIAYLLLNSGDHAATKRVLEPELSTIRALGDSRLLVEALLKLGTSMHEEGWDASALHAWTEASHVAHAAGYEFGYMAAISNLGGAAYDDQRDDEARTLWLKALEIARRRRDLPALAKLNFFLGIIDFRAEDMRSARVRLSQSAELYERVGQHELAARAKTMARDLAEAAE